MFPGLQRYQHKRLLLLRGSATLLRVCQHNYVGKRILYLAQALYNEAVLNTVTHERFATQATRSYHMHGSGNRAFLNSDCLPSLDGIAC